jgi:dienelactone hydrolase
VDLSSNLRDISSQSLIFFLSLVLYCLTEGRQVHAEDWVTFNSAPTNQQNPEVIRGSISKPLGNGPFPAVVIAHGCFGIEPNHNVWAQRLTDWGYATIVVDSFTPRNESSVCSKPNKVAPRKRAYDVYGAVAYLRKQPYVKSDKIGMIGFSHGGWTALYVGQKYLPKKAKVEPIQAVVSYYPWCEKRNLKTTSIPLLVLAGSLDTWTPIDRCHKYMEAQRDEYKDNIVIKAYENAYHGFDDSSLVEPKDYDGYTLQYNATAAQDSINETKSFFARQLD